MSEEEEEEEEEEEGGGATAKGAVEIGQEPGERIILVLDPGRPIELTNLTDSFAAIARIYERHYRTAGEEAPKLYVTRLETGSIIAEITPYVTILGAAIYTMDGGITVSDFTNRLWRGIKAFANPESDKDPQSTELPEREDAYDFREFVRPLTGELGARLSIKHARLEQHSAERRTIAEYTFDETELNRATVNIDKALKGEERFLPLEGIVDQSSTIKNEVMLFLNRQVVNRAKNAGELATVELFLK